MGSTFRWGIIGTARINRKFVAGLRSVGHAVAIVGSRDAERGRIAAAEYGAERAGSYEDVLAAQDVDGVYISLPNSMHREWTVRAAAAGRHVLCEKPMATSAADCESMVAACARRGVQLVEGFMYRYHPQWQVARNVLAEGAIGEVRFLRAAFGFMLRDPKNIRLIPSLGGGALMDVGCYTVSVARWFLGEPTRVQGTALDLQGAGVDTHAAATLEFPSGRLAALLASFEVGRQQTVELVGERGRIEITSPFTPTGDCVVRIVTPEGERVQTVPAADAYGREAAAFERLIRAGTPSLTPGADAANNLRVLDAWRNLQ